MLDLIYIAAIVGFFGLMLAFVRGLERLGGDAVTVVTEERDRT